MTRPGRYNKLPLAAKRAEDLDRVREPTVSCPDCDAYVMPVDMPGHLKRCEGRREPSPRSSWVNFRGALAMGVARSTLSFWSKRGDVLTRGEPQDQRYLVRDLAKRIAARRRDRRR